LRIFKRFKPKRASLSPTFLLFNSNVTSHLSAAAYVADNAADLGDNYDDETTGDDGSDLETVPKTSTI